ncbi:MAG: hypothetical protein AB9866_05535 [Syntrophobacteraceae bacterium]
MNPNRFSKPMPALLVISVSAGLRLTPTIAERQNLHCIIINDSTLFVEHRVYLFGDLKVKTGSADLDEYDEVEVDIQPPVSSWPVRLDSACSAGTPP